MDLQKLRLAMRGQRLGTAFEYHQQLGSTNTRALHLAHEGALEGLVILAETQSEGRGRREQVWRDVAGTGLLVSVVLRPDLPGRERDFPLLSLATGVAMAQAMRVESGVMAGVKWPNDIISKYNDNDVLIGKLGGVLLEASAGVVVVGTGVNLNAVPVVEDAALQPLSLCDLAGHEICREDLLLCYLHKLQELLVMLEAGQNEAVVAQFNQLDFTYGITVTLSAGQERVTGIMSGIAADGALLLKTEGGLRRFTAGEVTISRSLNKFSE